MCVIGLVYFIVVDGPIAQKAKALGSSDGRCKCVAFNL